MNLVFAFTISQYLCDILEGVMNFQYNESEAITLVPEYCVQALN